MNARVFFLMGLLAVLAACGGRGHRGAPETGETLTVYKSDGSVQCAEAGVAPQTMKQALEEAGVTVLCAASAHDGLMRASVCGNETGRINVYRIPAGDLEAASDLGFQPTDSLSNYSGDAC